MTKIKNPKAIATVQKEVEDLEPKLIEIADKVWTIAELSLQEEESATYLIQILEENEFNIDSVGTCNIPTAFTASYGSGSPVIGVLMEYDALPDLGNEPVAEKTPRKDGKTTGHGCGHNLIGTGGLGAAIAMKNWMKADNIPGTIRVFGAAAEETEGAKIYMARDGVFDGLDACLHWHPAMVTTPWNCRSTAMNEMNVEFFGKSSHAALAPWLGRNALHAAELFGHGIALMREHLRPTARTHYIYTSAGSAPNVVVDYASIKIFIRDDNRELVEETTKWVKEMAEGAAMATQTTSKSLVYCGFHDLVPNKPMGDRLYEHTAQIGLPEYTDEEIEFAKKCQTSYGVEPTGMPKEVIPPKYPVGIMGGSTDVAEVSWNTPTMGLMGQTMPEGCMVHTWQATACHGMSIGHKGLIMATKAIASLGVDLFTDPDLLAAAKADFKERIGDKVFKSPLDPEMDKPLGLKGVHINLHEGHDIHINELANHVTKK